MTRPTPPPLARSTLDRSGHRRKDEAWLAEAWQRAQVLVIDLAGGGRALVADRPDGGVALLLTPAAQAPAGERWFLGVDEHETPLWAVDAPLPAAPDARPATVRDIGHLLDDRDAGIFTTAAALGNWHLSHLFSPRTGAATKPVDAGWARVDADGNMMWPRTDPAMIVLVHDGVAGAQGRCLLGHNAAWGTAPDGVRRFSCLAGFVEPGESAEAAVAREVHEEVGLRLDTLQYAGSQSWPYPGSLMLGFLATAAPDQPLLLDPDEIDEAYWFTREEVAKMIAGEGPRRLPMRSSIARFLIEKWLS